MKSFMRILFLMVLFSVFTSAAPHSVSLNWIPSTTVGVSYNVYRAPCTGTITAKVCSQAGVSAVVGASPTASYTDSTVAAGGLYDYSVTAVCTAGGGCPSGVVGESTFSNHIGAAVPTDTPNPPTGLNLGTIAFNFQGNNGVVDASWRDSPGITIYWINQGNRVVSSGYKISNTGIFNLRSIFPVIAKTGLRLTICNFKACIVAQQS